MKGFKMSQSVEVSLEKLQQALFCAYDIKNNMSLKLRDYIVNPDTEETIGDYIGDIIDLLESMEGNNNDC